MTAVLLGCQVHASKRFIERFAAILAMVPYSLRRLFTMRPLSRLKVREDTVLHCFSGVTEVKSVS